MNQEKSVLIEKVQTLLKEIEQLNPPADSLERYLINNLHLYLETLTQIDTPLEIDKATTIFSRFCTESMDWDTPLFRKCMEMTKIGFRLAKNKMDKDC